MIICSTPRSGATKYCMDLEEKTGLKFIGELNPMYIDSYGTENTKAPYHETGFQPSISADQYVDYLINKDKYIVLCNQTSNLLVHESDVVVLRKSIRDTLLSTANFLLKSRPYLHPRDVIQQLHLTHQNLYGILVYLNRVPDKEIVWYEEYFGLTGTSTTFIDNCRSPEIIMREIDRLIDSNDSIDLIRNLYG